MAVYKVTLEELVRIIGQLPPGEIITIIVEADDG